MAVDSHSRPPSVFLDLANSRATMRILEHLFLLPSTKARSLYARFAPPRSSAPLTNRRRALLPLPEPAYTETTWKNAKRSRRHRRLPSLALLLPAPPLPVQAHTRETRKNAKRNRPHRRLFPSLQSVPVACGGPAPRPPLPNRLSSGHRRRLVPRQSPRPSRPPLPALPLPWFAPLAPAACPFPRPATTQTDQRAAGVLGKALLRGQSAAAHDRSRLHLVSWAMVSPARAAATRGVA